MYCYVSVCSEFHVFDVVTISTQKRCTSSLPPAVTRRAYILFTLFVFAYVECCSTRILLCFCFVFLRLVYPMLPVFFFKLSIFDWPFSILYRTFILIQKMDFFLQYIYIPLKIYSTVLELDLWADKFLFFLGGIGTHTIDTLQPQSHSLMSSTVDHSAVSAMLKYSFNNQSVTLSRKGNLEIDIRHVSKRV